MQLAFHLNTYLPISLSFHATPPPPSPVRPILRRKRRKLDLKSTLINYEKRMLASQRDRLPLLANAYLSTFQVYSTEAEIRITQLNNAMVLMRIARAEGIPVKAVTSECKYNGEYRAALLPGDTRDTAKIVYVGNYNYFTQHHDSEWCIIPCDRVYQ
jgi:hypothetical protein